MQISSARRRPASRGFMTVEMLVAVAIVLLVGTVAIASLGTRDRATLRDQTAEVALFLQQARMQALESGRPVAIRWDDDAQALEAGTRRLEMSRRVDASAPMPGTRVFPSGESGGFELVLSNDAGSNRVRLDWLTGKVTRSE